MSRAPAESLESIGVLVTRPAHQADHFINLLRQAGARPVSFPAMEIGPPEHPDKLLHQLAQLAHYDMLIFISANAVDYGLDLIRQAGQAIGQPVAAIGQRTASQLQQQGIQVSLQPDAGFNTEALLAHPAFAADQVGGKKILILRGQGGRELLADSLRKRGARVEYAEVYQRRQPDADSQKLRELWRNDQIQIVTVTSNEVLKNLYDMLDMESRGYLLNTPLVVPGSRTTQLAREMGFTGAILTAANATDEAMLDRVRQWHDDPAQQAGT